MGTASSLPLPERIPRPNSKVQDRLAALGLKVGACGEDTPYVPIDLGDDFEWVDKSYREDIPTWYIVNKKTRAAVVRVSGTWKGTHDNKLRGEVCEDGFDVVIDKKSPAPIPSVNTAADAVDTLLDTNPAAGRQVLSMAMASGMYAGNNERALGSVTRHADTTFKEPSRAAHHVPMAESHSATREEEAQAGSETGDDATSHG